MGFLDLFRRRRPADETRATGFTAEVMAAREAYITGSRGIAELTATAQLCVSMWEHGLSIADVEGAPTLDHASMALAARSMALRGESVFLIRDDRLVPCVDWDLSTRDGEPRAYRLSIPEVGGGRTRTALAPEVLHFRIGADPAMPWIGSAPLRRASLTGELLQAVEAALKETFENAPLGSQIVPLPDSTPEDMERLRQAFRARRGRTLVIEGVAQATAAGMNPQLDKRPESVSPDLSKSMTTETLSAARDSIMLAFGVIPALANASTTGPVVREAERHAAQWTLQPIAELMAEEATRKLGSSVRIDVMRPLQAFDTGGRARAAAGIVQAMAQAQEAGIDPEQAWKLVGWDQA